MGKQKEGDPNHLGKKEGENAANEKRIHSLGNRYQIESRQEGGGPVSCRSKRSLGVKSFAPPRVNGRKPATGRNLRMKSGIGKVPPTGALQNTEKKRGVTKRKGHLEERGDGKCSKTLSVLIFKKEGGGEKKTNRREGPGPFAARLKKTPLILEGEKEPLNEGIT